LGRYTQKRKRETHRQAEWRSEKLMISGLGCAVTKNELGRGKWASRENGSRGDESEVYRKNSRYVTPEGLMWGTICGNARTSTEGKGKGRRNMGKKKIGVFGVRVRRKGLSDMALNG